MIPGFTDFERVGEGGFATVFRARDVKLGRDVAVKVLKPLPGLRGPNGEPDADQLRRFQAEATALAGVGWHPNIAVIHDSGTTDDGRSYLIMEYLPDGSFADRLAQLGPLTEAEVLPLASQLADALKTVHEAGLIHRDIKPSNVLVGRRGEPKLADFGIVSVADSETTGLVAATVVHAAPEILLGGSATPESDIFSLGSTLFTLLTGVPPFHNKNDNAAVSVLDRMLSQPPADLRRSGISDALAGTIARCLDADPAARPGSAEKLGEMLDSGTGPPPTLETRTSSTDTAPTQIIDPVESPTRPMPRPSASDAPTQRIEVTPSAPPTKRTGEAHGPPGRIEPTPAHKPPKRQRRSGQRWPLLVLAFIATAGLVVAAMLLLPADNGSDEATDTTVASTASDGPSDPPAGFVLHTGDHFTAAAPDGWNRTLTDRDEGYGFRTRWQNDDGHFIVIDVSPGAAGGDPESGAREIATSLGSRVTRDVEEEDIAGRDSDVYSFEFSGRSGDDRIDIFFDDGGHGFAVLAGGARSPDSDAVFTMARTVAASVQGLS